MPPEKKKITWDNLPPSCKVTKEMSIEEMRAPLREFLLAEAIVSADGLNSTTFQAEFDGSGDSGYLRPWDINHIEPLLHFFEKILEEHVTYDWYNNDGGGGEITWDIKDDTLKVEGYVNVIESVSQPTVEL